MDRRYAPETSTIAAVFGYNDVVPKSLDLARDITPLPQYMNEMVSYSLWWIIIQHDWYMHKGDLNYLKKQKKYLTGLLKQILTKIDANNSEALDGGGRFLDWPISENKVAIHAGLQAMLVMALRAPFPYWGSYEWPVQPKFRDKDLVIDPSSVIDISKNMTADGQLKWNVPNGNWIIMRTGMTPTGVHNSPASPEGTGLEVDKMSKKHVAAHFDAFLGKIMERTPAADRKTWKVTVEDSYETGGQNWTDGMIEKFEKQFGYSPLLYLPVMNG